MTTHEFCMILDGLISSKIKNRIKKYIKNNEEFKSFKELIMIYSFGVVLYKRDNKKDYPIPKTLKEFEYTARLFAMEKNGLYALSNEEYEEDFEMCEDIFNGKYKDLTMKIISETILKVSEIFQISFDITNDMAY